MKLNKYTWELYKQSEKWKEASALFDPENLAENEYRVSRMFNQYDFSWLNEDEFNDQMESLYAYSVSENQQPCSLQESRKVYESIISHGLYIEQEVAKIQIDKLIEDVPNINPVWLITGNGSPFGDSHHSKTTQKVSGAGNVGVNFGRSSGGGTARSVVNQTIITASPMRQKARCSRYYAK